MRIPGLLAVSALALSLALTGCARSLNPTPDDKPTSRTATASASPTSTCAKNKPIAKVITPAKGTTIKAGDLIITANFTCMPAGWEPFQADLTDRYYLGGIAQTSKTTGNVSFLTTDLLPDRTGSTKFALLAGPQSCANWLKKHSDFTKKQLESSSCVEAFTSGGYTVTS